MSSDERTRAEDKSNDRIYFIVTPRLVWALCEDPYEYTFWNVVKDIAGEKGECILSREDLAVLAMMSNGKASACRDSLIRKKLLIGDFRRDPGYPQPVWHLTVPDFWEANVRWARRYITIKERVSFKREQARREPSPHDASQEPSPGDRGVSPGDGGVTPGDTKKNVLKNQKEEPESIQAIWARVLEEIKPGMLRGSFESYAQTTQAVRYDGNAMVILAASDTARDWLESRVKRSAERLLVGILSTEVVVTFVVPEEVSA
jgi:hypothetical protein